MFNTTPLAGQEPFAKGLLPALPFQDLKHPSVSTGHQALTTKFLFSLMQFSCSLLSQVGEIFFLPRPLLSIFIGLA